MPVKFFDKNCQEQVRKDVLFGICDDQNNTPAYTTVSTAKTWIAKVENDENKSVIFTAIDNCIEIRRENGEMGNRCDGMLTYDQNIVFIELKDERSNWIPHAIEQLEATILQFNQADLLTYRHRRAFACNKRHPNFHVINNELSQRFFTNHRVRLNIQATIKI